MKHDTTLVLGGGGIAGLGWFAGVIWGLFEEGVDIRSADHMIGTSAGSATAVQLRSAQSTEALFAQQTDPALIKEEPAPTSEAIGAMMSAYPRIMALTQQDERLAAMGALALNAQWVTPHARRETIAQRLSDHDWPESPLTITAIDISSGKLASFDCNSGVDLVDATSASCAVPGIWPVVSISGRDYMDGGVYSSDNAHLAADAERILIVSPFGDVAGFPRGYRLDDQIEFLKSGGSRVLTLTPDAASRISMGTNPFDPSCRAPAAFAGRTQGRSLAKQVAAFWL